MEITPVYMTFNPFKMPQKNTNIYEVNPFVGARISSESYSSIITENPAYGLQKSSLQLGSTNSDSKSEKKNSNKKCILCAHCIKDFQMDYANLYRNSNGNPIYCDRELREQEEFLNDLANYVAYYGDQDYTKPICILCPNTTNFKTSNILCHISNVIMGLTTLSNSTSNTTYYSRVFDMASMIQTKLQGYMDIKYGNNKYKKEKRFHEIKFDKHERQIFNHLRRVVTDINKSKTKTTHKSNKEQQQLGDLYKIYFSEEQLSSSKKIKMKEVLNVLINQFVKFISTYE